MALFQYSKKVDGDYPGPSYLIHKEHFGKKSFIFNICSKHGNCCCTSAISCWHKGSQENVSQDQCWEEGRDWTACSRAQSASNSSVRSFRYLS